MPGASGTGKGGGEGEWQEGSRVRKNRQNLWRSS